MRFLTIFASLILVVLQADLSIANVTNGTTDILPPCGLRCIEQLTLQSSCSLTNITCICTDVPLSEFIGECVRQNCTVRDQLTTERYSKTSCGVKGRDRSKLILGVAVSFGILALLAFGLRITSKLTSSTGMLSVDDYVMIIAVCFAIPLGVSSIPRVTLRGLGKDIWNVSFEDIEFVAHIFFWDELIYLACLPTIKISILLFFLRIFPRPGFKYGVYTLIAFNIGYLVTFEIITIWQCRPIDGAWRNWDGTYPTTCSNVNLQSWMSAAFNIIMDICMLILPLPEFHRLPISRKKKIHMMLMFSVGFFVTVVSVLRLKSLVQFANTTNMTQDYTDLSVWSTIEVPMGIICACLPSIRTLLRSIFPTICSSTTHDGTNTTSSTVNVSKIKQLSSHGHLVKPRLQDSDSIVPLVRVGSQEESQV